MSPINKVIFKKKNLKMFSTKLLNRYILLPYTKRSCPSTKSPRRGQFPHPHIFSPIPSLQTHSKSTMSVKHCGHHEEKRRNLHRHIFSGILAFIILILFVIFLIFIILRPSKPHFVLQDVTVLAFNVSATQNSLTTNIQVTVASRNPNDRIGVYYEKLDIFATYRSQQITLPTLLPTTYQGHGDVVVWSPFLYGNAAPVAPFLSGMLSQDLMAGLVLLNVKIDGRLKWKVGTWFSGRYHIHVDCPAYISTGGRRDGIGFGPTVKYQLVQNCIVDV